MSNFGVFKILTIFKLEYFQHVYFKCNYSSIWVWTIILLFTFYWLHLVCFFFSLSSSPPPLGFFQIYRIIFNLFSSWISCLLCTSPVWGAYLWLEGFSHFWKNSTPFISLNIICRIPSLSISPFIFLKVLSIGILKARSHNSITWIRYRSGSFISFCLWLQSCSSSYYTEICKENLRLYNIASSYPGVLNLLLHLG